jgi:RNA polymerase sigma factor (sigma-70 family)
MELRTLIANIRAGDAGAFTALARRYQNMAHGYAFSLLHDFQLAEDAVQEAFLAAYCHLNRLQAPEAFPGWLRGIVRHQCQRILRRQRLQTVSLETAAGVAASTPGPERQLEAQETRERVLAAIRALPQPQREVTALYYIQEYSHQEIAAFLEVPVSVVNNRLHAARIRLKRRMLPMVKKTLHANALPQEFADRLGRIVAVRGPVVDVQFAPGDVPSIFSAVTLSDPALDQEVTLEVAQHLSDGIARCIFVSEAKALPQGAAVVPTGVPVPTPVAGDTLRQVADILGSGPTASPELLETGIKAIDLFCPFTKGGRVGVFAEWGVGVLVLLPEILHDLALQKGGVTLLVFVPSPADAPTWNEISKEIAAGTDERQILYIPVADPLDPAFGDQFAALDAKLYLTRRLAEQGMYPAIDPFRSSARRLDPALAGEEHVRIAQAAREMLRRYCELQFSLDGAGSRALSAGDRTLVQRARRIQRFLTQPFFVAEPYTQRPGRRVPLEETLRGLQALLSGEADALKADSLAMIGALDQAKTPE